MHNVTKDSNNVESTIIKGIHGFEIKLHLEGHIKKDYAVQQLKKFVEESPEYGNNVKIITCALMGHGNNVKMEEGDWLV